jgi:hypothetical protein
LPMRSEEKSSVRWESLGRCNSEMYVDAYG